MVLGTQEEQEEEQGSTRPVTQSLIPAITQELRRSVEFVAVSGRRAANVKYLEE